MAGQVPDLDSIVDYKAEYTAVVSGYIISGDSLQGLCPFHKEKNRSFSANLKTGQWNCFTEGTSGNFLDFWAALHGTDTKEAYRQILQKYGVANTGTSSGKKAGGLMPYSLEQYARDKGLPQDFLTETCRLATGKDRDGTTFLEVNYFQEDGAAAATRKRYGAREFRWKRGSSGKICLYGEWRLPEMKPSGWVVLVEGESDTHTLWHLGFPAIGVAGASMLKDWQTMRLKDLQVYLHQEPDAGGETFRAKIVKAFHETGFKGTLRVWSCKSLGYKDPSETYLALGKEQAANLMREAMHRAELIDIAAEATPAPMEGAPIALTPPAGWNVTTDRGILWTDPKTGKAELICRTPLLLTQRLKSLETGDEKIEIAFYRDGAWQDAIFPRSTIFSARGITALSDLGCTVTSENARGVVKYLGDLEAQNIDAIPRNDSASSFGWQPGRRFIPGHAQGITMDIEPAQRPLAAAYTWQGSLGQWVETMRPHRQRDIFRFILAAGFAAPLLRIVKQRIFFVYNWGGSKGGKTAALKAALSIWGDPERLMMNFNATQVGLERTAAFYCDLPLGIDERQLAGTNQQSLEKIVYMIASGKGKTRGSKAGGIQTVQQWRTVAIATGEEPLSGDTTQTGVSTRVLELYGPPFDNETDAAAMHQSTGTDYGWAGPAFMDRLLALDESEVVRQYDAMQEHVREYSNGKNGAHIAGIATVALADALAGQWIFGEGQEQAMARAMEMAANILQTQIEQNATDVNENAAQFVLDFVLSHKTYFNPRNVGECYGYCDNDTTYYILPTVLNEALKEAGYSPRKTMRYLAEQGIIGSGAGKKYTVPKRFGGRVARFIEFFSENVTLEDSPPPAPLEELSDTTPVPEEWTQEEMTAEELPF